jgi:uncharacterized PurR-regulated membrane protein YhhQ (DUF165 family)
MQSVTCQFASIRVGCIVTGYAKTKADIIPVSCLTVLQIPCRFWRMLLNASGCLVLSPLAFTVSIVALNRSSPCIGVFVLRGFAIELLCVFIFSCSMRGPTGHSSRTDFIAFARTNCCSP